MILYKLVFYREFTVVHFRKAIYVTPKRLVYGYALKIGNSIYCPVILQYQNSLNLTLC